MAGVEEKPGVGPEKRSKLALARRRANMISLFGSFFLSFFSRLHPCSTNQPIA
jgi:hypothetical protein